MPLFICFLLVIWAVGEIGVKEAKWSRWPSSSGSSWGMLRCFPSQMRCNNPCVLPWGHFSVGCALNRSTGSRFDGLLLTFFVNPTVFWSSWCQAGRIHDMWSRQNCSNNSFELFHIFQLNSVFLRSFDLIHFGAGTRVQCSSLSSDRVHVWDSPAHILIAFLSAWQNEPTQYDVSVFAWYLSQNKGNCVLFQAASGQHSTNSNSLLNAARLHCYGS